MKILYIAHRIPYPPNKGDKIRSFNEIKYLSRSHDIHLACLADDPADLKYKQDLGKYCSRVCVAPLNRTASKLKSMFSLLLRKPLSVAYFYSPSLQRTIDRWLAAENYDAVICFSSPMAEYIFRSILRMLGLARNPQLIMDFCDLDSDKWLQYSQQSRFPLNLVYRMENERLFEYEKRVNRFFDHSLFVAKQEADLLLCRHPEARNITIVPNGIDHEYFSPDVLQPNPPRHAKAGPLLLFTGAMDYHANIDGVTWFADHIFPLIKQRFAGAEFYVVGSNPHESVLKLQQRDGVKVTGFVEDIRPYYQAADICVVPLRLARGVQNKVLEAMSMAKPVVATAKANQGITAESGIHLLIEDTPQDFADAVSNLFSDPKRAEALGTNARQFVTESYDWTVNLRRLEILLNTERVSPLGTSGPANESHCSSATPVHLEQTA